MIGPQLDLLAVPVLTRLAGCGDAQIEQPHTGRGLALDVQILRLGVATALGDARIVAAGKDDFVELLVSTEAVVGDHVAAPFGG